MTSLSPEQLPVLYEKGATSRFSETDPAGALRAIGALPTGSLVLLLGAADTGKTTFARDAVNSALSAGAPIALIDADIGQSEIGPPGTIGVSVARPGEIPSPVSSLHSMPLADAAFVGATAPPGHLLPMVAGVVRMAHAASRELGGEGRILVDMPGFIAGPSARALTYALAQALEPALVLGFARKDELLPVLSLFRHLARPPVVAIARPGAEVGRKSAAVRSARRVARLAHYLAGVAPIPLSWDSLDLINSPLGGGVPIAPHLAKFIGNMLGTPCLYGERAVDGALYAILAGPPAKSSGVGAIEEQFKTRHITVVPETHFKGLLCGLADPRGHFLGIGLIERLDYLHRAFVVQTPVRRPEAVAQVTLGVIRARPDGREIGHIRPGSV